MAKQIMTRSGKNASEVRRKWAWENPHTVIDNITFNGITPQGAREYMIFYHKREKESKKSKTVKRLKSKGARFGKASVRK